MFFKDERETGDWGMAGTAVKEGTSALVAWSVSVLFKPDSSHLVVKHVAGVA